MVASTCGVRTCFVGEFELSGGGLSSIATGFRVPNWVKKNIVQVAYAFQS